MEDYHHLLIFERVHLWWEFKFLIILLLVFYFGWSVPDSSTAMVSFPFDWEDWAASRPLVLTPHLFLGTEGLNFLADYSAISTCSISSFYVQALRAPIWTSILSKKLCRHVWSNMGNGMPAEHRSERLRNLSMYSHTNSPPFLTVERSLFIVTSISSS